MSVKVDGRAKMEVTFVTTITEPIAKALVEITQYGNEAIIKSLASSVSSSMMEKHGNALDEYLTEMRRQLMPFLTRAEKARMVFDGRLETKMPSGD